MSFEISPSQLGSQQHCVSAQACGKGKSHINKEREREREREMVIRVETPVERGRCPKKRGHLSRSWCQKGQVWKKIEAIEPKRVWKGQLRQGPGRPPLRRRGAYEIVTEIAREKDHRWRRRWMDRSREKTLDPRGMEMGLDVGHFSGNTPGRRCSLRRLDAWRSSRWSYQRSHLHHLLLLQPCAFSLVG